MRYLFSVQAGRDIHYKHMNAISRQNSTSNLINEKSTLNNLTSSRLEFYLNLCSNLAYELMSDSKCFCGL